MTMIIKRKVAGILVKLLFHRNDNRGMTLIEHTTRCITKNEIVELVVTDQKCLQPNDLVNRVGFIGFAEINQGGVIEVGDEVRINGEIIGEVCGFDACHYPNHYNVVISSDKCFTSTDLNIQVNNEISFYHEK